MVVLVVLVVVLGSATFFIILQCKITEGFSYASGQKFSVILTSHTRQAKLARLPNGYAPPTTASWPAGWVSRPCWPGTLAYFFVSDLMIYRVSNG